MKNLFSNIHILLLVLGTILIASCEDNTFDSRGGYDGKVGLKLALSMPGGDAVTRAGGTGATTGNESGTDFENLIDRTDIRLLIFSESGEFQEEVNQLRISGGNSNYYLEGVTAYKYEGTIVTVVFANAKGRGVQPKAKDFKGKTVEEVYQLFKFAYGNTAWTVDKDNHIPMWGSTSLNVVLGQQNSGNVNMYRAIAKVGFTVNDGNGLDNFRLTSIRVYFSNKEGYCAPMPENIKDVNLGEGAEIMNPSVPATSGQWTVTNPLVYAVDDDVYEDKIYLPEANNKNPDSKGEAVCIVVGGIKSDGEGLVDNGEESFYRIDFKDDLENKDPTKLTAYDILRNHLYKFNIKSVSNPGTGTPEDALDKVVAGLEVDFKVEAYAPMRSIPDQYTLTTSTSVISFDNLAAKEDMTVTTDYGLEFTGEEAPINGNGQWAIVDEEPLAPWFRVRKDEDDNKTIYIEADQNYGVAREGYFYVRSGNLKKQIIIRQEQPPTANCYVASANGTYDLIVIIKGNGNKGLVAEGTQLDTDASLEPAYIGIIWETHKGLVTVPYGDKNTRNYNSKTGIIQYTVNTTGATIPTLSGKSVSGGNALIGAFDADNNVIWSWHIWVCPDFANGTTSHDEDWTLNKYHVMDRNLGAITNKPGVASMGLLYQWGRKDPFIGAAHTNDEFTDNGRLSTENYTYDKVKYDWSVASSNNNTNIDYTIKHPTTLTRTGLSQSTSVGTKRQYLWGSNEGLKPNVKDVGSKTIYDPCPIGYRVPPVDAFVFTTNVNGYRKSSDIYNWNENLKYIPHSVYGDRVWQPDQLIYNYNGNYVGERRGKGSGKYYVGTADYYGFYMNYKEIKEPMTKSGDMYNLKSYDNVTWLPLTGAYDPTKGIGFKNGNSTISIQQGSSITVNSFLWTNSSVENGENWIPAAMFLHGTETGGGGSGRHIHGMTQSNIKADPHYAGAVRCVRDVKKDFSDSNMLAKSVSISNTGAAVTATLKSVNDQWWVVDSGDYWLTVSPERGSFDKGKGQDISFKAQQNDTGDNRSATVLIQFGDEAAPRAIEVTQRYWW